MEAIKIIVPLLAIAFGLVLKYTNHEQNKRLKKYWWIFVFLGIITFIVRLANHYLFE